MLKKILAVLTACIMLITLAGAALAETAPAAAKPEQLTLQDLEALNGGSVTVHKDHGKVTFVGGTVTDKPVTSQEEAEQLIAPMMALLGGDESTRFVPWRVLTDPAGNKYYVFQQMFGDILALGGAVKIITDRDGSMLGLTGSVIATPEETETAQDLTAEEAEAVVVEHEKKAGRGEIIIIPGKTEKTVLPVKPDIDLTSEKDDSRYVWIVYTSNAGASISGSDLPYLAHYVTMGGEYLYSLPTIVPGDTAGTAGFDASYVFEFMEPVDYTGYVDYSDGTEREITVTLMRDSRTGMYYLGNIEHKIIVADCWEFLFNGGHIVLEYSPDNREWDQTSLISLYNYCRAYDYYRDIGWVGGDGEGTPIVILKGYCDENHNPVNNAAYASKYYGCQVFLSSSINDFAQALDVIAHEFTHCVTHTVMTYNSYQNDYGAINEAISDIHGNICEMMAGATVDGEWLLGENSMQTVRSMSDPHDFGQPAYVWDVYYRANVKEPTEANDHGGVHGNSSLLNRVAYLLCTDGGMSLEDARAFWFAVDCSMVPGSDYPQLKELLPWVLKNEGMDAYQDALAKAIEATRLGQADIPDSLDENMALLTLTLPDNETFNNGNWILQVSSINIGKIVSEILNIGRDIKTGNLEGYPTIIREMFTPAAAPDPSADEEKTGLLELLVTTVADALTKKDEKEIVTKHISAPKEIDPAMTELKDWARDKMQEMIYQDLANAGQDGHTIRMMSMPGRTLPILMYISVNPGSTVIELIKYVVYFNGRWYDISGLMDIFNAKTDEEREKAEKQLEALPESEVFKDVLNTLFSSEGVEDAINKLTLDIRGGQAYELTAAGLDQVTLESGMRDVVVAGDGQPNDRKSRPKEP